MILINNTIIALNIELILGDLNTNFIEKEINEVTKKFVKEAEGLEDTHSSTVKNLEAEHERKMVFEQEKLKEIKMDIEQIQEDHEKMYNDMQGEYEHEKNDLEQGLEDKKKKLVKELSHLNLQRKSIDGKFVDVETDLEKECVEDYLEMNWNNDKSKSMIRF